MHLSHDVMGPRPSPACMWVGVCVRVCDRKNFAIGTAALVSLHVSEPSVLAKVHLETLGLRGPPIRCHHAVRLRRLDDEGSGHSSK